MSAAQLVPGSPMVDPLGRDALDFWLGEWDLRWPGDGQGTNRVTRVLDGRVILEEFEGRTGSEKLLGMSLSVREGDAGPWRQTWVDSTGSYLDLVGVEVDGRIAFQREMIEAGARVLQRMIWRDVTADGLRWEWQRSSDEGATWETRWPIDYRRRRR